MPFGIGCELFSVESTEEMVALPMIKRNPENQRTTKTELMLEKCSQYFHTKCQMKILGWRPVSRCKVGNMIKVERE